jgi:HAD superfamily hydrolase (TIGR01509 family)
MIPWDRVQAAEAIIFDCDGTLVDSMPIHFLAWNRTMKEIGIEFPEDRFYAMGGIPTHRIIEMLAHEQQILVDAHATAKRKEEAFFELMHLLEPIHIIIEVAQKVRGLKPIAVASGGSRFGIEKQLRHVGILDWFDTIVCAEDTVKHKPDPDVFLESARRLGVVPEKCLVFEDAELGIQAAKGARMDWLDVRDYFESKRIALD